MIEIVELLIKMMHLEVENWGIISHITGNVSMYRYHEMKQWSCSWRQRGPLRDLALWYTTKKGNSSGRSGGIDADDGR